MSLWGAALPVTTNLLHISHVIPRFSKDYSPLAWMLGCFAFAIAIFRYHLLDLMPIARQALVDNMAEGMLILDKADHIVEINRGAQAIIGLRPDEAVGRPITEIWQAWRAIIEPPQCGNDVPHEIDLQKAGSNRWYEVRTSFLPDKAGHPAGRLVLMLDVTRRKEMEEKLRQSNLELQARNAELDAFAHMAAHDLKHPLTVIAGFSELIEGRLESTRERRSLAQGIHAHHQAHRFEDVEHCEWTPSSGRRAQAGGRGRAPGHRGYRGCGT